MTLHVCSYDTPLEVLPGDELKMTCQYSSMNRNYTTKHGPGGNDEMCYGFITYYPKEARDSCFATHNYVPSCFYK